MNPGRQFAGLAALAALMLGGCACCIGHSPSPLSSAELPGLGLSRGDPQSATTAKSSSPRADDAGPDDADGLQVRGQNPGLWPALGQPVPAGANSFRPPPPSRTNVAQANNAFAPPPNNSSPPVNPPPANPPPANFAQGGIPPKGVPPVNVAPVNAAPPTNGGPPPGFFNTAPNGFLSPQGAYPAAAPPPAGTLAPLPPPPPNGGPYLNEIGPAVNGGPPSGQVPPLINGPPVLTEDFIQATPADVDVFVRETQTGRFMFGVGVNSDAGVTGQIVIDERNFDWRRVPTGFQDFVNGTAFRGGGQSFRLEAMPGTQVQRYLISFTEPYLLDTPISLNLSGFYYDRNYFDWDEQRLGGRVQLGYRLTHDLSVSVAGRAERVDIVNPRVLGVRELDEALGRNELFSGRATLTHDTRDMPFAPTEGHLIELSYEQAFGSFDYPRADIDLRKYFLIRERPDGSGRHTLTYAFRFGFAGNDTPIYDNYFAGGYSTIRGFDFRGASPEVSGVTVGGEFRMLGTAEYMFPLTADDMIKGVVFCDFGTVEEDIEINSENYRVAPGFGLRINLPAFGPAPLALDLAFPVAHAATDDIENFSFFIGLGK